MPVGTTDYWMRLTKAGNDYTGEYSFDGDELDDDRRRSRTRWLADFGIFAFGPQPEARATPCRSTTSCSTASGREPCVCEGFGDDFEAGTLNRTRWNNIIREQQDLYNVQNGALNVTTVNGDIYQDGDPAPTRNFFLQTADHAGENWVIETRVDGGELSDGYEHAGLLARVDDDNYIKYNLISDAGNAIPNRIELRSEVGSDIQNPQPQLTPLPAGTEAGLAAADQERHHVLRGVLVRRGNVDVARPGGAKRDGVAELRPVHAGRVQRRRDRRLRVLLARRRRTGCEPPEPENRAPVINAAAGSPSRASPRCRWPSRWTRAIPTPATR